MIEEKKEVINKEVEEETTVQDDQPEEKKTDIESDETEKKNEDVEEEVLFEKDGKKFTAKELETLRLKAKDFDGIIEKRRLEKLSSKNKPEEKKVIIENKDGEDETVPLSKVQEMIDKAVSEKILGANIEARDKNLSEAYSEFLKEHSWANSDEVMEKMKEHFSDGGQISKEGLLTRLKLAAQNAFPEEYVKVIEEKAKARVHLQEIQINAGDSGGGSSVKKGHQESANSKLSTQEKEIVNEYFGGDAERYLKAKSKEE
jgi:hypothetical protein